MSTAPRSQEREPIAERAVNSVRRAPLPRHGFAPYAHGLMHWTMAEQREIFDLNPPYQRGSVWTTEQRQNLIKSLLLGIPIGTIVYNLRDKQVDGKFIHGAIVDGKQRIEALRAFVDSEFGVPAWWFEDAWLDHDRFAEDDLVTHSDLTVPGTRFLSRLPVPSLEARVSTIEEEAAIFDLINTAGTAQDEETIRAARAIAGAAS